jgi:uncharacterized surface protein with fasciclin (FAS1) repeats
VSNNVFQKSIAAGLGLAIATSGLFFSVSGQAQTPTVQGVTGAAAGAVNGAATGAAGTVNGVVNGATGVVQGVTGTPKTNAPGTTTTTTTTTTQEVPVTPAGTTTTPATAPVAKTRTLVDIASKDRRFKTLVTALKAADLVDTLAGTGPFTVFAPTDAAFAKIGKKTLANLLKPENKEKLKAILTYHVVSGAVTSDMLKAGEVPTVLPDAAITVKIKNGAVSLNNGPKLKKLNLDIKADNGVFHIIDSVLMPPAPAPKK